MAYTFVVDDVERATEPAKSTRYGRLSLACSLDEDTRALDVNGVHPLLAAVHVAFSEHRPLVLSPDAIWLTIAQGVAQHVRLHAEALRRRLVRHEGKKRVVARMQSEPRDAREWASAIGAIRNALTAEVGDGRGRLFTCDFTTTTDAERIASEIVLLDVYSPYCDYVLACVCGIPEVTLLGTPADWRAIRERVEALHDFDLGTWHRSLTRICDELVAASEGAPDFAWWREIYKPRKAYGRERITGWIARLFPYVGSGGVFATPNPLLAVSHDDVVSVATSEWYAGPGITTDDVPSGVSHVPLRVETEGRAAYDVTLSGGLLAVEEDALGRIVPRAGWSVSVARRSIHEVLDRLCAEHAITPPETRRVPPHGSAELVALYDRCETASLFAGRLRILGPWMGSVCVGDRRLQRLGETDEGTVIAIDENGVFFVRATMTPPVHGIQVAQLDGDPSTLRRVGDSLADFLWAAMERKGELP
jgi:hypothetical protein